MNPAHIFSSSGLVDFRGFPQLVISITKVEEKVKDLMKNE
jgi:hypothetical protein